MDNAFKRGAGSLVAPEMLTARTTAGGLNSTMARSLARRTAAPAT